MRKTSCRLLVALLAARSLAAASDDSAQKYFYEDVLTPFFALDRAAGLHRPQRPDSDAAPFSAAKPANGYRVFLVGGSIASEFGLNPRSLEEALAQVLPGRKVEVVNVGMPGYDSFRERPIAEEVLGYEPDLIVLLTGHNESTARRPVPGWRLRLASWLAPLRFVAAPAAPAPPGPEDDGARLRGVEENLRAMLSAARRRGVTMAVAVPAVNYRDNPARFSPEKNDERFRLGWEAYLAGDCSVAREAWTPPTGAWSLFYGARCAEKAGRRDEARRLYLEATDSGWQGCPRRCRELIRAVAKENGALVADVDAAFRRAAPGVLPGLDMFADTMHWHPERNALVTLEFLRALEAAPPAGWDKTRARALAASWARAKPDPVAGARTTFKYALRELSTWPQELNWLAVAYLERIHAVAPSWFDDPEATVARLKAEMESRGREWNAPPIDKGAFDRHYAEVRLRLKAE